MTRHPSSSHFTMYLLLVIIWTASKSSVRGFSVLPPFRTATTTSTGPVSYNHLVDRQRTWLSVSASTSATNSIDDTSSQEESNKMEEDNELSMPWSNFQEWALRDQLPKYVISIPVQRQGRTQYDVYALWRALSREVTELSGYPVDFLQERHDKLLQQENKTSLAVTPQALPLLDEFEFATAGGLSGRVYGIPGVADGSKIETTPVSDVHKTVQKGYVQTEDGAVAYELGLPLGDYYSLDGISGSAARTLSQQAVQTAAGAAKGALGGVSAATEEDPDTMLVRLAVSTGVLLAGATAMNMLSHHLTVNVFWV